MAINEQRVTELVERVVRQLMSDGTGAAAAPARSNGVAGGVTDGQFATADEAITAAERAQQELAAGGLALRQTVADAMRRCAVANAERWGRLAREDTGMGRAEDKTRKNLGVANGTPGLEDLPKRILKGDQGMHLIEGVPWGVICAITPSTNPTATVINNGLAMIVAGNGVVFCPHPGAASCTRLAMSELNRAIVEAGGPANLMTCTAETTIELAGQVMNFDRIPVIAATGGPGVVKVAMQAGKKVFAAGPGNPPSLVDQSADLDRAAMMTVRGASFDNNLPCTAEKVGIVEAAVLRDYLAALQRHGARLLTSREADAVLQVALDGDQIRRESIGQDAAELLRRAGLSVSGDPRLLVAELPADHPLVQHEQLMPFLPVVAVRDFEAGIAVAQQVEHGYGHTAICHSRNTENITRFAGAMRTTITVINGPSYSFAGDDGEGYGTMTVTTPTGEGVTSPRTWQRTRHLVYSGMFST